MLLDDKNPFLNNNNRPEEDITSEHRTWAILSHVAPFCGYIVPFGNMLGPLIIWLIKGKESKFVADHARGSLNFQISMTIYLLAALIFIFMFGGSSLFLSPEPNLEALGTFIVFIYMILFVAAILAIGMFIFMILGAVKASKSERFEYPLTIEFVK